jgi:hypothetical protein
VVEAEKHGTDRQLVSEVKSSLVDDTAIDAHSISTS